MGTSHRIASLLLFGESVLNGFACASGVPEPRLIPSTPHVSWRISVGGGGRSRLVCQSDPRTSCAIDLTSNSSLVTVNLYVHPSLGSVDYTGHAQVDFIEEGAQPADLSIAQTVKAEGLPVSASVTGHLVRTPGIYHLKISVRAATASDATQTLDETVAVTVRPKSAKWLGAG